MSGRMRKGLFDCITIAEGAHHFVYILVRITGGYVIRNMAPDGEESGGEAGFVVVSRWKYFRRLILCRFECLFVPIVHYFGWSQHREILLIRSVKYY